MSQMPTEELTSDSPAAPSTPTPPAVAPSNSLYRRLELAANVAIVVVAVILSAVLVKKFLLPDGPSRPTASTIKVGTQMSLPGVNWQESAKTVLLFLSPRCGACTDSAPLYRQLAERCTGAGAPRLIPVFAGDLEAGRQYLEELQLPASSIVRANPQETGVRSTPTLLIVDKSGRVVGSWRGKLPEEKHDEVYSHLTLGAQAGTESSPAV